MPKYFFHVDDGTLTPDAQGLDLPDLSAAKAEAIHAAGSMLSDFDGHFWSAGTPWTMQVTDEADNLLFSLQFTAKIPGGQITFTPHPDHDQTD